MIEFEPRLLLEVTAPESDVQRVTQAIQQVPDASTYLQVIDAQVTGAVRRQRARKT
jgi:hypothetical protein